MSRFRNIWPLIAKIQKYAVGFFRWLGIILAPFVIGFIIGWLTGLSVSPVVNIVIAAIVGVIAALGPKDDSEGKQAGTPAKAEDIQGVATAARRKVTLTLGQLALIAIGIFLGTSVGIVFRTHDLLSALPGVPKSTPISREIDMWATTTSLERTDVADRLFAITYPDREDVLEMDQDEIEAALDFWSSPSVGISRTVVAQRLFDLQYGQVDASNASASQIVKDTGGVATIATISPPSASASSTVAYSDTSGVCTILTGNLILRRGDLYSALQDTPSLELLSVITETEKLQDFIENTLCHSIGTTPGE